MTIIVQIPSKSYTPRTFNVSPAIPAGTKQLKITLTRESWPSGPVGSIAIKFPDGSNAASVTFEGGEQLDIQGNVQTRSGLVIGALNGPNLPNGTYAVAVQILQTVTTSVLAERF